jgi:hypothetical protein
MLAKIPNTNRPFGVEVVRFDCGFSRVILVTPA